MVTDQGGLFSAATAAHAAGRLDEADRLARRHLESRPDDLGGNLLAGILAVKRGAATEALPFLARAKAGMPGAFEPPFWLAMAYRAGGQRQEAHPAAVAAVEADPTNAHAHNLLGMCDLDLDRRADAVLHFTRATELAPTVPPFFDNLGRALQSVGRNTEAIGAFRRVVDLGPVRPGPLFRLGDAYMAEPNAAAATQCARAILAMDPHSVQGNLLLARALIGDGHVSEGADAALRTIQLAPGHAVPVAYYGRALQSLGRISEAEVQFRRAIELEPRQGFAYYSLVTNHRVSEDDFPLVNRMAELAQDAGLPKREIIQLEYGLGKAREDLGEYEDAMRHYDRANQIDHELKTGVAPFDPRSLHETGDFILRTFDEAFFEQAHDVGNSSDRPIFVVGMMRSGTTLAEQILSSHPMVGGAGELLYWPENLGSGQRALRPDGALDVTRLRGLATEYLALLARLAPDRPRVVDKMNTNYLLLGLLHAAFPNARLVAMRRHPVDTCLSIWATPVANGIDLCARKENLVAAYREHVRIMAHWRQVLPADRLIEVPYETLVTDQASTTRSMVEFCGLPWDEACLRPQDNERSVKTPSVWQVRQPVYRTSMARWRKFEPWLGPFAELFDAA